MTHTSAKAAAALGCALLLLAACSPSYEWYKPGAGPDDVMTDISACRFQAGNRAESEYGGRVRQLESRAGMPSESGRESEYRRSFENERMARAAPASQLTSDCMEERGYAARSLAPR